MAQANVSPGSSLHLFNHLLRFDSDVIEFIRRSKKHMARLRREFKTLANADITGRLPNVKAEFMPCIANLTNRPYQLNQMEFEKKCIKRWNDFLEGFCFKTKSFGDNNLSSIRNNNEWADSNVLVHLRIDKNSEIPVFVRWNYPKQGWVKLVGQLDDVDAAMSWLQHECDRMLRKTIGLKRESSSASGSNDVCAMVKRFRSTFEAFTDISSHSHLHQFKFLLKFDTNVIEFVRRSKRHMDYFRTEFKGLATVDIIGRYPKLEAEFIPSTANLTNRPRQTNQMNFEKECIEKLNKCFAKFGVKTRTFDNDCLNIIKSNNKWTKRSELICIRINKNFLISVFIRWSNSAQDWVKVVGALENVDAAMSWLQHECDRLQKFTRLKGENSCSRHPSRCDPEIVNEIYPKFQGVPPRPHLFNHLLKFDRDLTEFIRRSKFHLMSLRTNFRALANVEITGWCPNVVAEFMPRTAKSTNQMNFEMECIERLNKFFAKFSFKTKSFGDANLSRIRRINNWRKSNDLVIIKINDISKIPVFVRWNYPNQSWVKVVGLCEDVDAAMSWLQHECDKLQNIFRPKLEKRPSDSSMFKRFRPAFEASSSQEARRTQFYLRHGRKKVSTEISACTRTTNQRKNEFQHSLRFDRDVIEYIRHSSADLAFLNNDVFKDLAQVTFVGKEHDPKAHFKARISLSNCLTDQRSFETECIEKLNDFCKTFGVKQEIYQVDSLDFLRNEHKWKNQNEKISVPINTRKNVSVYVRWNHPQPGHTKLVGLSKDVDAVSEWLQFHCSAAIEKMTLSKTQIEILEAFEILSDIKSTCNVIFEINKADNLISFGGARRDILECKRKITDKLKDFFNASKPLEEFVKQRLSNEIVLQIDYPVALFIRAFGKENGLMSKLKDSDWRLSKEKSGIALRGYTSQIGETIKAFEDAERNIIRQSKFVDEVGIAKYLRGDKGKTFLKTTESATKCIILIDSDNWQNTCSGRQLMETQLPGTNISFKVIQGDITEIQCDAVVNCSYALSHGEVTKNVLVKGGDTIKKEMNQHIEKMNKELEPGFVITTTGGLLPCKKIIHVLGPSWTVSDNTTASHCLENCVQSCLNEAKKHNLNSIALPAISCGVFGGKGKICVPIIVKAVEEYFHENVDCSIKTVNFIENSNEEILCLFKDELTNRNVPDNSDESKQKVVKMLTQETNPVTTLPLEVTPLTKPSDVFDVKVIQGDILGSDCDVIAIPKGGQISKHLVAQTGQSIMDEYETSPIIETSNYRVTSGGALPCKNIFHVVTPGSAAETEQVVGEVLQAAENLKKRSLALAAIGTGAASLDSASVSNAMRTAIDNFKQSKPVYLKKIEISIYDAAIIGNFQTAMSDLTDDLLESDPANVDSTNGQQELLTCRQSIIPEKQQVSEGESIQVFLCSDKQTCIDKAWKKIMEHFKDMSVTKSIKNVILASIEDEKELLDLESKYGVLVRKLSGPSGVEELTISGLKENVVEAFASASELMRQAKEILFCAEYVKWQYLDGTNEMKNFSPKQNWQIENDYKKNKKGQTTINAEVKGTCLTLQIDFTSMKETCLETSTVTDVCRTLKSERKEYPSYWSEMKDKSVLVENISVNSAEYVKVQQQFLNSAIGKIRDIKQIERIQNPTLYDQFLAQKNRVECRMRKLGSRDQVTRELFHGTCREVCENIFKHGFDRSHAGKHATAYGRGVYFATTSEYSHGYTTPNFCNKRTMFLADVITGQYCLGGSQLVTPPTIPGSNNDPYDSTVNNTSTPSMFVVFKDASVYPLYLITYT
ncbi:uncharacterized protein LOC143463489 isoform X2 [Clavelina lepadiformis]|uniref:uncharacterized protein LOC143463489 isoform X2 n=1 Tax=Clavelina lepadiformis TaxID=159417 RepID=UPI0040416A5E